MQKESKDSFELTPLKKSPKKRYLPEEVLCLEMASPLERSITVIVLIKSRKGNIIRVPVNWCPVTGVIKRMHKDTWGMLGIQENISRIRNVALRMAKKEHERRIRKYSTPDMYGNEED
jgi:hypothetical protein